MAMTETKGGSGKYFYASLKGSKKNSPEVYFEIRGKGANGYETLPIRPNELSGYIESLEWKQYTYENELKDKFVLTMRDADEVYIIEFTMSQISRGIINALANVAIFGKICIKVYQNDKGFATSIVTNDGEKTGWKYDHKTLQDKVEVLKNSSGIVKSSDYTKLDEFIKEVVSKDIINKLKPVEYSNSVPDTISEDPIIEKSDDDDLPF